MGTHLKFVTPPPLRGTSPAKRGRKIESQTLKRKWKTSPSLTG
jgi:hypothetical protein